MAPISAPKPTSAVAATSPTTVPNPMTSTNAHNTCEDADTSLPTSQDPAPPQPRSKKRKRKDKQTPHILHQSTFRRPAWSYFHLRLTTPGTASLAKGPPSTSTHDIDPLTISPLLHNPLSTYLGVTGSSIPIDMLKTQGREVWLRVPRQDARAMRAALSGWVGSCEVESIPGIEGEGGFGGRVKVAWRVLGEGGTLMGVFGDDGGDVFAG